MIGYFGSVKKYGSLFYFVNGVMGNVKGLGYFRWHFYGHAMEWIERVELYCFY